METGRGVDQTAYSPVTREVSAPLPPSITALIARLAAHEPQLQLAA